MGKTGGTNGTFHHRFISVFLRLLSTRVFLPSTSETCCLDLIDQCREGKRTRVGLSAESMTVIVHLPFQPLSGHSSVSR